MVTVNESACAAGRRPPHELFVSVCPIVRKVGEIANTRILAAVLSPTTMRVARARVIATLKRWPLAPRNRNELSGVPCEITGEKIMASRSSP